MYQLRLVLLLLSASTLTIKASLEMFGTNATVQVEKAKKTSAFSPHALGPEYVIKLPSEDLTISCSLKTDVAKLNRPKIDLQKFGDQTAAGTRLNVVSELSADGKSFRAKLTMTNANAAKAGAYTCLGEADGKKINATIAFLSLPLLSLSVEGDGYENSQEKTFAKLGDVAAVQGGRISIACEAHGYPTATVQWYRVQFNEQQRNEITTGNGSQLELSKVDYVSDRGFYVCRALNSEGKKNSLNIFLRVKHPRAYLAPLILLVVQVVIVIAIYVVYELSIYEKRWREGRRRAREDQGAAGADHGAVADVSARKSAGIGATGTGAASGAQATPAKPSARAQPSSVRT